MGFIYFLSALLFVALGVYGGICAFLRGWRGEQGFTIFEPLWAMYFALAQFFCLVGSFSGFHTLGEPWWFITVALFPFGVLGTVLWGFGMVFETGARMIGPSMGPVARTFDVGDGFMTRNMFAEAEREYRKALAEEPGNIETLLRLSRALEGAGKYDEAARELSGAHERIVATRHDLPPVSEHWQARLLTVTYALGDTYASKLNDSQRAQALYKTTLELLYGYRDANPLRERLKRLEYAPDVLPKNSEAMVPERLAMDEER
jgi:tetratricopeptide (TPR) repeat protein